MTRPSRLAAFAALFLRIFMISEQLISAALCLRRSTIMAIGTVSTERFSSMAHLPQAAVRRRLAKTLIS